MAPLTVTGFEAVGSTTYLNTAAMALGYAPSVQAMHRAADAWASGRLDWGEAETAGEECRSLFAGLVGASTDDVAIIPVASAVAGQVAAHVIHQGGGGSVVVGEAEYTSNYFPWRLLEHRGFDVRLVPQRDGRLLAEDVEALADDGTRLVAVSGVQSASGWRADLGSLREIADRSGALLYVDAAQMAGALAIDVAELRIDALAAPAQKFLLGTRGMGYAYFAEHLRESMLPVSAGWKAAAEPTSSYYGPAMDLSPTASRYDLALAWIAALADRESMSLLGRLGTDAVAEHNLALVERLGGHLREAGVPFLDFPAQNRSTIVSVAPADPGAGERLAAAGVAGSMRAGRIRVSMHLYNTIDQMDRVAALLIG